jgi:hypothetical protein
MTLRLQGTRLEMKLELLERLQVLRPLEWLLLGRRRSRM